jgi:hypothetical protein
LNKKEKEILEYSTRKTDYTNFLTPLYLTGNGVNERTQFMRIRREKKIIIVLGSGKTACGAQPSNDKLERWRLSLGKYHLLESRRITG